MTKIICQVYRSSKKNDMYLYVDKKEDLSRVPAPLLTLFGAPKAAMVLMLSEEKKLARVDVNDVMQQIIEKGYFLQMPAGEDDDMRQIANLNSKLSRA